MDIALWIVVCLFASVGIVQLFGWVACQVVRPKEGARGYYIFTLPKNHAALEQRLRYGLMRRRWGTLAPDCYIILLDNGLDEEGQAICRRMLEGVYGAFVCAPGDLAETLATFDDLQTQAQRI